LKPFGNQLLRQALAMSIDRVVLAKTVLIFGQIPAFGFVPPSTWNYDQQQWTWQSMSDSARIEESRRLYGAAGYSASKPLHLRILFNSNPEIKKLSVAMASMWKANLGIDTELNDEEYRVFLDSRKDVSRWDIARLSWVADYNDAGNFLDIFRTRSPNNDAGYSNKQFDALLDDAAATADPSDRKLLLEKAEDLMLSEYPVMPIYFYSSKRLIKPYVKGARTNPLNRLYSKHLSINRK
jgi:oligopeptide transport system substrate-binding protein